MVMTTRTRLKLFVCLFSWILATPVHAAGMSTHALMGDMARSHLPDGHPLIELLAAHRPALIAGAMFPDGGYFTGAAFDGDRDLAETAHWDGFVDALASVAYDKGCGELGTDVWDEIPVLGGTVDWAVTELGRELPLVELRIGDSCGYLVAFLMGVAAHGMSDETWDALFEPQVYQREEQQHSSPAYLLDSIPPGADPTVGALLRQLLGDEAFDALAAGFEVINGVEYSMDVILIRDHKLWAEIPVLVFPPPGDIVEAFARSGHDFDELAVQRAALGSRLLVTAERAGSAVDYVRVRDQMPYATSQYMTGSGGVHFSAEVIAGYYEQIWSRVTQGPGNAMPPFVAGVHPRPGERGIPVEVCTLAGAPPTSACTEETATLAPESDRTIYVAMSASMGSDFSDLDEPFAVFDEAGNKLPVQFKQAPPWASPQSAHGFEIELVGEGKKLKPNHRYTVVVTTQLYDRRGADEPEAHLSQPMIWQFTTGNE